MLDNHFNLWKKKKTLFFSNQEEFKSKKKLEWKIFAPGGEVDAIAVSPVGRAAARDVQHAGDAPGPDGQSIIS